MFNVSHSFSLFLSFFFFPTRMSSRIYEYFWKFNNTNNTPDIVSPGTWRGKYIIITKHVSAFRSNSLEKKKKKFYYFSVYFSGFGTDAIYYIVAVASLFSHQHHRRNIIKPVKKKTPRSRVRRLCPTTGRRGEITLLRT